MTQLRPSYVWLLCLSPLIFILSPVWAQDTDTKDDVGLITASSNGGMDFLSNGKGPTNIEELAEMQETFQYLAKEVADATVNIALARAQGSGVVVSRSGYILTAAHVINNRPNLEATITFADGSKAKAITLGVNPAMDSGVLKIVDEGKWPFLDIGESSSLERGQWVMAIGHPGGLTRGRGLVFRTGRIVSKSSRVITTDCTLVGGDSGGPLVDLDGYVVGIHSRIGSRLSDNHHVPIDSFSEEWDELIDGAIMGPNRAYLGVYFGRDRGINKIEDVIEREAAAKAGMKTGDVITEINGQKTETHKQLTSELEKLKPKEKAIITIMRDDEELKLEVTLGYAVPK